jgi:hypothetical protein
MAVARAVAGYGEEIPIDFGEEKKLLNIQLWPWLLVITGYKML